MSTTASSSSSSSSTSSFPLDANSNKRLNSALSNLGESVDIDPDRVGDDGPAWDILREAEASGATDLHVSQFRDHGVVQFRLEGLMVDVARGSSEQIGRLIRQLKVIAGVNPIHQFGPVHGHASLKGVEGVRSEFRLTAAPTLSGEMVAVRFLDPSSLIRDVDSLGMSSEAMHSVRSWMDVNGGLFLIGGPTGSGKTTSMYAFLNQFRKPGQKAITIEDPAECELEQIDQIQIDPQHDVTIAEALRGVLRLDPDLIGVGEVRDPASARAAVRAALSGHSVITTVHAPDAVGTVTLLRHWGVNDYEIAAALSLAMAQRLVRRLCPECRREVDVSDADRKWCERMGVKAPSRSYRPVGCDHCRQLGYRGRIAIFDVWCPTQEAITKIRNHVDQPELRPEKKGSALVDEGVLRVDLGATSMAEVIRVCGAMPPQTNDRDDADESQEDDEAHPAED